MLWLMLIGAYEVALPEGGEAVVDLVIENQTDTLLKEPWIFVFSKPDWLSVSPDSVITHNLAKGEKVELRLKIKSEPPWFPGLREGTLRLRVLVRNGEVAPDFVEFKVKEEPYEVASLVPWLLAREYTFTHTLTEHYDYYPIVFLHGWSEQASYWTRNRHNPLKAESMIKIAGFHEYWLYDNGWGIAPYTTPASTIDSVYPKRVIYNFDYYKNPWDENPGAIGSNGKIYPVDPEVAETYRENLGYPDSTEPNSYAKRLSFFINAVCDSAYTDKVHIVAHSEGGVVARAAMGWYGCSDKVNRLLMLATPNNPIKEDFWDRIVIFIAYLSDSVPDWAFSGELADMRAVLFTAGFPHSPDYYLNYLNRSPWQGSSKFSIIGGNLNASGIQVIGYPFDFNLNDDGLLDYETVYLPGASFTPVHYSAHGTSPSFYYGVPGIGTLTWFFNTYGEMSLTANTFTVEFIKTWVIEGNESRAGSVNLSEVDFVCSGVAEVGGEVTLILTFTGQSLQNIVAVQIGAYNIKSPATLTPILPDQGYFIGSGWHEGFTFSFTLGPNVKAGDVLQFVAICYSLSGRQCVVPCKNRLVVR